MPLEIIPIPLTLPFLSGSVNCYLVEISTGFVLVDTGVTKKRSELEKALASAGCQPGNLKLIVITHGDFDHTGNAAYLRRKYGVEIAMHSDDTGMTEKGDMFWNRKSGSGFMRLLARNLLKLGKENHFRPDVLLEDGQDLFDYGWDARVVSLPGHSRGSIGVLTARGDLLCGDLFDNTKEPALNSIMDDLPAAQASLEKLRGMGVCNVYPGHGAPFRMEELAQIPAG